MPVYQAPVADTLFVLNDVLRLERYNNLPGFSEASSDLVAAILVEAARVAAEVFQPLNQVGDRQGCTRHPDGSVTTPDGFKAAYETFCAGGWGGLSADPVYGGQGLPHVLTAVVNEFLSSANMALAMYPGLTAGAIAAIARHGSDAQKRAYLPAMIRGAWTGTMNLTEPHCGTDLGLLRTRAVPQGDGSYAVSGQKIFISSGEHDLSQNIVHLVLARIEGAPAGTKGLSLFIVPKVLPGAEGRPGRRNAVACGAVEDKMGIHGNATCVMNYDGAAGFLLGEAHKGLRAMFTMMNEARLGVGIQGLAVSEAAYQNAAAYARDRRQGRSLSGVKSPDGEADPIIVHPDIRRILMTVRSVNEAGRALILWTALQGDLSHRADAAAAREAADDWMGLLTPVIKGVLTDRGFENAVMAQQVHGGHGYIREWGMEQFVRDARIAQIYEGANGIQALDLVGRKLALHGGRALQAFLAEVGRFCEENHGDEGMAPFTQALRKGSKDLQAATLWLMGNAMAEPDNAGAASTDYMHLFGLVALGYMWGRMAKVAQEKLRDGDGDAAFLRAKLVTGRFFTERVMPETAAHLARICAGAETMMALEAEAF